MGLTRVYVKKEIRGHELEKRTTITSTQKHLNLEKKRG